ncbi:hypothetical protein [Vibrio sp. MA40-2]|uniref:hypothetical protein n=1 Tax=Vibrio sp. MA40-2 TaxID=3391828 RepID=UPI0039A5BEE2
MNIAKQIKSLTDQIKTLEKVTIAVSGGIDSMVLSYLAHQAIGTDAQMVHATSAAVPKLDTKRVMDYTKKYGWNLKLVETGEMNKEEYLKNPVNRCYHCKTCLYSTLNALNFGQVLSGTNLDDLSDYRPGLIAAKENNVVHPYVDNKIDKNSIRAIARYYQLDDLSDLPASPCLSSRVETGVYILPDQLALINDVESMIRKTIQTENIRCRFLSQQLLIEIDSDTLALLSDVEKETVTQQTQFLAASHKVNLPVQMAQYQRGSAFVGAV